MTIKGYKVHLDKTIIHICHLSTNYNGQVLGCMGSPKSIRNRFNTTLTSYQTYQYMY